jgi:hypothetical protein
MQTPQFDTRLMQSVDVGGMVRQGIEAGQAEKKQREISEAMQALVANPNDPAAVQGIAKHDPRLAMQIQGQQQQSLQQRLERDRENIVKGAEIIRGYNPQDQASWDNVRGVAAQMGIDVSQVPQVWDENAQRYAQGMVRLADTFAPRKAEGQPNIAKEVEYYRSIGRSDLADKLLVNHADPTQWVRTEDDTGVHLTPLPRSGGGMAAPSNLTLGAIVPDPRRQGGPASQAPGGFPEPYYPDPLAPRP